eukprot:TRINITY_DN2263_c0_g1_i1.p2 TRINITY_DN2263_c0_g1~~TRINITY_DN2263_c0_g1_i1.p2  ORF type:complete len:55 (+),score=25.35 TRINITY_DN2263_c0_g1_i1:784-948(+)
MKIDFLDFLSTVVDHSGFQIGKTCQKIPKDVKRQKKKKYRLRGRSSETAKAHRG